MDRMFFIIISALCFGAGTALAALAVFSYLSKLDLDKKFKERSEKVSEVYKKGVLWNFLFISEKAGELSKRIKYERFEKLRSEISKSMGILGGDYSKVDVHTFVGAQILFGLAFMVVASLVLDIYNIIFLLVIGILGFYIPLMWIKEQVKALHKAIFRQIPDVLDMLTMMVEAGLDFNTSLSKILLIERGPLISEFQAVQQEIRLGKSRAEAFEAMALRIKSQPLSQVIGALMLAIKTGGSLAPTLRTLSEQFRVERSQAAEKMAQEAPIKLMAPLVLLIFPTVFIILFGPIILSFIGKGF